MIFWFSLLIVIALLIFSLVSIQYTENTVMENSMEYTLQIISQVNRDIDYYIGYMENISAMMTESGDVQRYLFADIEEAERSILSRRIITQFDTVIKTRQDISNIAVVSSREHYIINNGVDRLNENISLNEVDWYMDALRGTNHRLTASHVQHVIRNNYKWVVTLGKGILNPDTGFKEAVFFIDLNYKLIKDLCENNSLATNSYVFIIDDQGKIIYHPQQQLLFSGLKEEKIAEVLSCPTNYFVTDEGEASRLYTFSTSEKTGWRTVGVVSLSELMKNRRETQNIYIFTAAALLLFTVLLTTFWARAITRPIKELKDSMKAVEKGNFGEASVSPRSDNEIGSLGNSFNLMTVRIKQLMEQNTYVQEEKRKSELKALRSQINPHFLYNTLDSIIWMAEGGKNTEVVRMTAALARLLRQSIGHENDRVTLEQEIAHARSYLIIQQMRYQDKLEYEIRMDESLKEEEVISLILQPLVENAIYHGIKYKGSKGLITITVVGQGDHLILKVADNGKGMDEGTLRHIFEKSQHNDQNNGVGVYNVHTRVQLYYGIEYGLRFESELGSGTTAIITIPRSRQGTGTSGDNENEYEEL